MLLDISMPGSPARRATRCASSHGPSLPIFVSGERVEAYDRAAGRCPAPTTLLKPLSEDELLARMRTLIARAEAEAVPLTPREREVINLLAEALTGARSPSVS